MRVYGLFGSGEFLPSAEAIDRELVERSSGHGGRVLVVPTASAPEGDTVFNRWTTMGLEHYDRLGLEPEAVALKVRADADDPALAARVPGARLIYFSGGNPAFLARTLAGTAFWTAVEEAVAGGCALGGSSAGISFLGAVTFDPAAGSARPEASRTWVPGIAHFPAVVFGPHWDAVDRWRPGLTKVMLDATPEGCTFVGVDEDTALVGDGSAWVVRGRGSVTVRAPGGDVATYLSGAEVRLALRP